MPTLTMRDWLVGTRSVAGAAGACGLMLLACSWFVLGPGALGKTRVVDTPGPVRIADVRSERSTDAAPARRARPVAAHAHHTRGRAVVVQQHTVSSRSPIRPPRNTQGQLAAPGSRPAPPSVAPTPAATPSTPASQPAPPASTLTAPALPPVNVPQVTVQVPPVSIPSLPVSVPSLTVTTPALELP